MVEFFKKRKKGKGTRKTIQKKKKKKRISYTSDIKIREHVAYSENVSIELN